MSLFTSPYWKSIVRCVSSVLHCQAETPHSCFPAVYIAVATRERILQLPLFVAHSLYLKIFLQINVIIIRHRCPSCYIQKRSHVQIKAAGQQRPPRRKPPLFQNFQQQHEYFEGDWTFLNSKWNRRKTFEGANTLQRFGPLNSSLVYYSFALPLS